MVEVQPALTAALQKGTNLIHYVDRFEFRINLKIEIS